LALEPKIVLENKKVASNQKTWHPVSYKKADRRPYSEEATYSV
jgi:hypothetical protein